MTRRERRALRRHQARRARMAGTVRREIKMSAAIIRMIEPYAPDALELDKYLALIEVCKVAWNSTVLKQFADCSLPNVRRNLEKVRETVAGMGAVALLEELQQRKTSLFPEDRRFIVETVVEPLESGARRVTAASTVFDSPVRARDPYAEHPPATEDSEATIPEAAGALFRISGSPGRRRRADTGE